MGSSDVVSFHDSSPLAILLEQTQMPDNCVRHLSGASLAKVEVTRSPKQWKIYLQVPDLLPASVFDAMEKQVAGKLAHLAEVHLCVCYDQLEMTKFLAEYWDLLWRRLAFPERFSRFTARAKSKLDGDVLTVIFDQRLVKEVLENSGVLASLANQIEMLSGRKLKVQAEVMPNLDVQAQLQATQSEEEARYVREALAKLSLEKASSCITSSIYGQPFQGEPVPLEEVREEGEGVCVEGSIFRTEEKELRGGRRLFGFHLTDETDSIQVKVFGREREEMKQLSRLQKGLWVKVRGRTQVDMYARELVIQASDIVEITPKVRQDQAQEKRVELHLHSPMSAMDGVSKIDELVAQVASWGHKAVAVTDHGVVQAFPEFFQAGLKHGVKVIFGMEAYVVDDGVPVIDRPREKPIDEETYVVFDTETTGLSAVYHELIEIAAVKVVQGEVVSRFESFVRPTKRITPAITHLTGITNQMVEDAPGLEEVLVQFKDFASDAVLVAHNSRFDMAFLNAGYQQLGLPKANVPVIDTVAFARYLYPRMKNYKLDTLCEAFHIPLPNHHRALNDAEATGHLLIRMLKDFAAQGYSSFTQLGEQKRDEALFRLRPFHATILVQNMTGLKNLYKLVSISHLRYFYRVPRIPKSLLAEYREGLFIGSACNQGELFEVLMQRSIDEAEEVAGFYDFLEVQPVDLYLPLIRKGLVHEEENFREIIRKMVDLGEKLAKPVVATGDVHFLNPADEVYRRILTAGKMDPRDLTPVYFRTTEEMLDAFQFLGEETARRIVIEAPNEIARQVEALKPFPDDLHTPEIEGSESELRRLSYEKARAIYGEPLPGLVEKRLKRELESIIGNGFAVIYYIAHKLVTRSLQEGYLVGSRGSVGSSFVATMTDITEVNPLPPHYVCPSCHYTQFFEDGSVGSGFDLPDCQCPRCEAALHKNGHDIPFETFMGFQGDKVPDIDLNFSGEYQPRAHRYTEELFGKDYVFRAGTISTVAEKTAYGFVRKYLEENRREVRSAEIDRLVAGCTGIKRTTGQHPGGLMVIPKGYEVYDFTPIQHPADDEGSGTVTTHFDYHAISGRLLKLDILGHDDPTVIRMLQDLTGVDPRKIPVTDSKVLSLFNGTEALGVKPEDIHSNTGTLGIPEFGTRFVRQMLEDTRPSTFAELVRISGLSHGTDVWLNNAQEVIRREQAVLSEVISTRDDIMIYLIHKGMAPSHAFQIMEKVRKGKGVSGEDIEAMKRQGVPEWYIASCQKIKYMFPKAHAVAYVLMALRIAWFKVYYPIEYYATYFSVRADDFVLEIALEGLPAIEAKLVEIEGKGNGATPKEKSLLTVLEMALEMLQRGFRFLPVDLYQSDATRFQVREGALLPPFSALDGVGESAAYHIVEARGAGPFLSVEDFQSRTRVSKTVIETMQRFGCFEGLPESNQLSLF